MWLRIAEETEGIEIAQIKARWFSSLRFNLFVALKQSADVCGTLFITFYLFTLLDWMNEIIRLGNPLMNEQFSDAWRLFTASALVASYSKLIKGSYIVAFNYIITVKRYFSLLITMSKLISFIWSLFSYCRVFSAKTPKKGWQFFVRCRLIWPLGDRSSWKTYPF